MALLAYHDAECNVRDAHWQPGPPGGRTEDYWQRKLPNDAPRARNIPCIPMSPNCGLEE